MATKRAGKKELTPAAQNVGVPVSVSPPVRSPDLGNGLWIWRLPQIRPDYLNALAALSCKVVYLKVFDDLHGPSFWGSQCTKQIINTFNENGITVLGWGYHFDKRSVVDPHQSAMEVSKGMDCGLAGYVVDLETETEASSTHSNVEALLIAVRAVMGGKMLGYTSFGHPGLHPNVPWQILDDTCDAAFPQIYFEQWTFGSSDEERVQAALKAHRDLNLRKPILPIWGSEEGAVHPASADVLQSCLNRFPGSSIFRAPDVGQMGQAWRVQYGGGSPMLTLVSGADATDAEDYSSELRFGNKGRRVKRLQELLIGAGANPGPIDGHFGEMTRSATKTLQIRAGLSPDGIIGPRTWAFLGGRILGSVPPPNATADHLASFAEIEAAKSLRWSGPTSEAEKYLKPFRAPMEHLGQIGPTPIFYNWCAAFVAYCCRQIGIDVPDQPNGFWATMALVESWKYWSRQRGAWMSPLTTSPRRGDIVCFEWNDGDVALDHIGIVRQYAEGSTLLETSEGNRGNICQNGTRQLSSVAGIIRTGILS